LDFKQAVLGEIAHGPLDTIPVTDLAGQFGDGASHRVAAEDQGEDRPLRFFVGKPDAAASRVCLHAYSIP
jgi:hypothetical protein